MPLRDPAGRVRAVEGAVRDEVQTEYNRLRNRYSIPEEKALRMAVARVKEAASAIADSEGEIIANDGYRQTRLEA